MKKLFHRNTRPAAQARSAPPLETALAQSKDLKVKIEAAADDLGAANEIVSGEITKMWNAPLAQQAVAESKLVEGKMREAAEDLVEVNQSINLGIHELLQKGSELHASRQSLEASAGTTAVRESQDQAVIDHADLAAFTASLAAELVAPLKAIHEYCGLLNNAFSAELGALGLGWLDHIRDSAERANRFADDLRVASPAGGPVMRRKSSDPGAATTLPG